MVALADHVEAEGRMATALVELENHPGHRLLATGPLTGPTATRWDAARQILAELWGDFGIYQAVIAAARTVRDRRARPGDREIAELRKLLLEPSIEIIGTGERIETITIGQLSARMDGALRHVSDVVLRCHELHQTFLLGLGPLAERVRTARDLADDLLLDSAEAISAALTRLTTRIDDLGRACVTDPLSLTPGPAPDMLAALDAEIATVSAHLAGLVELRDSWQDRLARLATTLDEIDTLRRREERDRRRAQELIADTGLATPPDRLPTLRKALASLAAPAGWSARAAAFATLSAAVTDAAREMDTAHQRTTGLLDRHAELRGRFEAYRAKAIRLGHAERPDVLALDEGLRRLLWTQPCDLAAATRALVSYQQLVQTASDHGAGRSR